MSRLAGVYGCVLLSGCAALPSFDNVKVPETAAEVVQGPTYSYRPLDPLNAKVWRPESVRVSNCRMLEMLPDETMRFAVGQVDASGKVSYGVANSGVEGHRYVVVLDYMKSTTFQHPKPAADGSATTTVRSAPTYVGVGLRLSANLVVRKGSVDLGSLFALGLAGEANQVSGSLMLQTLGVSGPSISAALAIPSDISTASIQAALVSIGTIKSKIYDGDTEISPRVIGTYDVFGPDMKSFDAYFSTLLADPPTVELRINSPRCDKAS